MEVAVDLARREWEEGHRRFLDEARDPARSDFLYTQVEVLTAELRRRVGEHFTLAELADAYATSDPWSRTAVAEGAAVPGWARTVAVAADAAFHLYARGAVDYAP